MDWERIRTERTGRKEAGNGADEGRPYIQWLRTRSQIVTRKICNSLAKTIKWCFKELLHYKIRMKGGVGRVLTQLRNKGIPQSNFQV